MGKTKGFLRGKSISFDGHTHNYAAVNHTHPYAASNHTHTLASLGAAAANHSHNYAAASHTHAWSAITGKPTISSMQYTFGTVSMIQINTSSAVLWYPNTISTPFSAYALLGVLYYYDRYNQRDFTMSCLMLRQSNNYSSVFKISNWTDSSISFSNTQGTDLNYELHYMLIG